MKDKCSTSWSYAWLNKKRFVFSKTKTAILAGALTKNNEKIRKVHGQTFDHHICDLSQHPLKMISAATGGAKKPCLRSFALFIAPDSITDFGIAQATHCNPVCCSFVLRIDWVTFSDRPRNGMLCKRLEQLHTFMMQPNDCHHQKKSAIPPYVTLYDETKVQFGCGYLETSPAIRDQWYQCCHWCHA